MPVPRAMSNFGFEKGPKSPAPQLQAGQSTSIATESAWGPAAGAIACDGKATA
jgi:hypothetical protein